MINKFNKLYKHSGFKRYASNTIWLIIEKLLRITVELFVGAWVARYLGPDNYGLLSYAQAYVVLFSTLVNLGFDAVVVQYLVKQESNINNLLGTAFLLKFIGFIIMFLIIIIGSLLYNEAYTNLMILIIASGFIFRSFNVIDFYFQSKVQSRYIVFANIISLSLSAIVKISLIILDSPLIYFALVIVFDYAIVALGFIFFYHKNNLNIKEWRFDKFIAKTLIKESWPLAISSIVVTIYMKIDQVMIKEFLDNQAVGQYAAAVRLSEAWYFIPVMVVNSFFPAIINAKKECEKLYYLRLQRLYQVLVIFSIFVSIFTTVFADLMIHIFYGNVYQQASSVLVIHIWASIFVFLGVAGSKWFIIENLQKISLLRTLSGMMINIILNMVAIPKYGINGAAIATLISQAFASYLFEAFNRKTLVSFKLKSKSLMIWNINNISKSII